MSSSLKFVVGALALASAAQAQRASDPLASLDLATAEAVPTECTADQLTLIYDSCIAHCQSSLPADGMVQCTDVNTRFLMVKCATEADKCGKNVQSQVVRQAQTKRLADLCSTASSFPIAEAKLVFASASDIEQSVSMQEQAAQLTQLMENGTAKVTSTAVPAVSRGGLYGSETTSKAPRTSGDMYPAEPMNGNVTKGDSLYSGEPAVNSNRTIPRRGVPERQITDRQVPDVTKPKRGEESYSAGSPAIGKPGKKEVSEYTWKQHGSESKDVKAYSTGVNGAKGTNDAKYAPAGVGAATGSVLNGTGAYKANGTMAGKPNSAIRLAPIASAVLVLVMSAFLL